jgi:hypothetical protein
MKSVQELIGQEALYFNIFSNKQDVSNEFNEPLNDNINILFAWYEYQDYSGDAIVIYEQDGVLYEVNGGHCSCYGLEGQWSPQTLELRELEQRLTKGNFGEYGGFKNELIEFFI